MSYVLNLKIQSKNLEIIFEMVDNGQLTPQNIPLYFPFLHRNFCSSTCLVSFSQPSRYLHYSKAIFRLLFSLCRLILESSRCSHSNCKRKSPFCMHTHTLSRQCRETSLLSLFPFQETGIKLFFLIKNGGEKEKWSDSKELVLTESKNCAPHVAYFEQNTNRYNFPNCVGNPGFHFGCVKYFLVMGNP